MGGRTRPPYPSGFKVEAVRLAREPGAKLSAVARDLGVSLVSLRKWVRQTEIDAGVRDGLTTEERPSCPSPDVECGCSRTSGRS